ncbi:MAG: hypothetical protein LUD68_04945 [Rikenellaceae bacterium]|nr:hypothetical protein [Rikenellaceae bacterium]
MKITRKNYEEFALDYLESTLSEEVRNEFEGFLKEEPEIAERIAALQEDFPVLIPDPTIRFEPKSLLKRRSRL